jgi:hypothetical protein
MLLRIFHLSITVQRAGKKPHSCATLIRVDGREPGDPRSNNSTAHGTSHVRRKSHEANCKLAALVPVCQRSGADGRMARGELADHRRSRPALAH